LVVGWEPGQLVIVGNQPAGTGPMKAVARRVVSAADGIIVAELLFHQIIVIQSHHRQALLERGIRQPWVGRCVGTVGRLRMWSGGEIVDVCYDVLAGGCVWDNSDSLTEGEIIFQRTTIRLDSVAC